MNIGHKRLSKFMKFPFGNLTFDECVQQLDWPSYDIMFDVETGKQNRTAIYINPCFLSINFMTRWLCGIGDVCQYEILNSTKSLAKAIDNLNTLFDFVGIVEYYDASWDYFAKKFKLIGDVPRREYVSNSSDKANEATWEKPIPLASPGTSSAKR